MPHDITVLNDDFNYIKHLHVHANIYSVLFKKLVTPEEYPVLARAKHDAEDLTITADETPALLSDILKLETRLNEKGLMSEEVLSRCLGFIHAMKEICDISIKESRNIEFVAGE